MNIFNKHCDRVKMANLAQMVNVLQSVLLTEGDKMVKTPTYHVFHMYRHHQGGELLDSNLSGISEIGMGEWTVPEVTESVSRDKDGIVTITLNNLSAEKEQEIEVSFAGRTPISTLVEANIVTGAMRDYNTFEAPDVVEERKFTDYTLTQDAITVKVPACSVLELRLK